MWSNKINILQKLFTSEAAPNSMVQMVYKANECRKGFIRTALETINDMNNIIIKICTLLYHTISSSRWFHTWHQPCWAWGWCQVSMSGRSFRRNRTHPFEVRFPDRPCTPIAPQNSARGWHIQDCGRKTSGTEMWIKRRKTCCWGRTLTIYF